MQVKLPMLPTLSTITETNFECKKCGRCCQKRFNQLVLSPMDVFVISRYLGITKERFIETKTMVGIISKGLPEVTLKTYGEKEECCFFNPKKGCEIHEVSPFQCYTYPIIPFNEEDGLCVQQPINSYCGRKSDMKPVEEWLKESSGRYERERLLRILWYNSIRELDELCKEMSIEGRKHIFQILFLDLKDLTVEALKSSIEKCYLYKAQNL